MAFNLPFATSELLIGSDKNKIGITNNGDMIFVDGSLAETEFPNGVTLSQLANIQGSISFDDLVDTEGSQANRSYLLFKNPDGSWRVVEYIEPEPGTVVENLDDIQDVDVPNPSNGDVLTYMNGIWTNAPKSSTIIIEVEQMDWTFDATLIGGDPGYSVTVPHNLGLTLPADLLDVSLWNINNELITLHRVRQNENSVYLESTVDLDLYVTMRKV